MVNLKIKKYAKINKKAFFILKILSVSKDKKVSYGLNLVLFS